MYTAERMKCVVRVGLESNWNLVHPSLTNRGSINCTILSDECVGVYSCIYVGTNSLHRGGVWRTRWQTEGFVCCMCDILPSANYLRVGPDGL